ncbi:hypothetical protein HHL22_04660 [Hymenobacter sp. RP-2-7]|uniref:Gliding motility-associated C-terminal domain-containing protein n=1 Tax=Hymenobacter polaris TaxID=2682546 RepID=A0A7Y0ACD6_9BACT|nr:gliding motility-associated C-terminal domain-containing protein [Hymenobacter polaris]NML64490.1 hypothetical protein [Hymenobacter polaris]
MLHRYFRWMTNSWPGGGNWRLGWLLALLLGAALRAQATHIVGGEMDLQYISGDTYQLTLNLYFDAVNGSPGALDDELTAGIYDKATNRQLATLVLPLISNTYVAYTNPACTVGSLSTKQLIYRSRLSLPAGIYNGAQGYYAAVERCCRNVTIGNIVNPGAAAQTFYLEFPAVVRGGQPFRDSTPRIFPPLADYACLGEVFTYDFGGQDPDGDSLVYDLVTPLNGHATATTPKPDPQAAPYTLVNWNPGLSTLNQIPGSPALTIGARTGRLQVRPSRTGLFVFGVRCQEFRRGTKIGETRRDFQLQVLVCPVNHAPSLALLPSPTGNVLYRPGRDTLHLTPGSARCVRLRFTDPDASSRLTLSLLSRDYTGPMPTFTTATTGTVHVAGQPDTLVASLCFPDCADTRGLVRHFDVLVADNGCSLPKHDTVHVAFTAVLPPNAPPTLVSTAAAQPLHLRVGQTLAFDLTATDPDADPLSLTMSGGAGGTLALEAQAGTRRVGHFSWLVGCSAVTTPPGQVQTLTFGASSTSACNTTQTAASLRVAYVVDYANAPPVLTSTFAGAAASGSPSPPPLIKVALGQTYTATLAGLDADRDVLALSAAGDNFDLAAAGMRLATTPSPAGQAAGTFTWQPTCDASTVLSGQAQILTVTFQLQETTCRPQPQTQTVRFQVINPDTSQFNPPNLILPTGANLANRLFTMRSLPADFCDSRFSEIRIFTRWGRQVYQSADRNFTWGGEGTAGIYYYLLIYSTGRRYKGWVEVIQ